jgi:hypothetical protein
VVLINGQPESEYRGEYPRSVTMRRSDGSLITLSREKYGACVTQTVEPSPKLEQGGA